VGTVAALVYDSIILRALLIFGSIPCCRTCRSGGAIRHRQIINSGVARPVALDIVPPASGS